MCIVFKKIKACKTFRVSKLTTILTICLACLGIFSNFRKFLPTINVGAFYADFTYFINRLALIFCKMTPLFRTAFDGSKVAFSLAEVLIVTMTVGIVAQMTLPILRDGMFKKATIVALKKSFASSSNAMASAIASNGTPDTWDIGEAGDSNGLTNINSILTQNFKIAKNCGTGAGCFAESTYKDLKGTSSPTNLNQDTSYTKFMLQDGTSIAVTQISQDCTTSLGDTLQLQSVCGMLIIDSNSTKLPNTYGKDVFGFAFTKYGLVPLGTSMQTNYSFNEFCNASSNKTQENNNAVKVHDNNSDNNNHNENHIDYDNHNAHHDANDKHNENHADDIYGNGKTADVIVKININDETTDKIYENGLSCTAWAMYNENMEYEDCSDLSWNGKKQCK